jgi:hypothetical protein
VPESAAVVVEPGQTVDFWSGLSYYLLEFTPLFELMLKELKWDKRNADWVINPTYHPMVTAVPAVHITALGLRPQAHLM